MLTSQTVRLRPRNPASGKVSQWAGDHNNVVALFASRYRISAQRTHDAAAVGVVVIHTQGVEK
jgi:hypothetical protein